MVFCVIDTEEETSGDGEEKYPLAWRLRTRCEGVELLIPSNYFWATGGLSIVFFRRPLKPKQMSWTSGEAFDGCIRFPHRCCSIFAAYLVHVSHSCSLVLDPYSGILRLLWIKPPGISWCDCVVPWWKRRKVSSWVHSWPVSISGTAPYDSKIPSFMKFYVLSELDEVLNKLTEGPSMQQQQQREPDQNDTSGKVTKSGHPQRQVCTRHTIKQKKVTLLAS